jgi:hypothetical protein
MMAFSIGEVSERMLASKSIGTGTDNTIVVMVERKNE